jgi:hypothetical protein
MFLPHRKYVTSPLRAQQVNAIYRFVINITIKILEIIHGRVLYIKQHFADWILSPSTGGTYTVEPNRQR